MLGHWIPHHEYQQQLILKLMPHYSFNKGRVIQMESTIMKLFHLDLDKALPTIKPLYSATGAPAKDQAAMIRSLFLMIELKKYSITKWAEEVGNDRLYYDICGFQGKAPSASSYYDFIDRLWLGSKDIEIARKRKLRSCSIQAPQATQTRSKTATQA